jgi:ABC-2 type transport system ATP-binding protein
MSEMIAIQDLSRRFGPIVAVDGLTFSVRRGEVLGFLGPNGAGKSTTMKMIAGFLTPTSGTATVCGFDVVEQPIEVRRRLGYLPEGAAAYPDMTPRSFLEFIADARQLSGAARRQNIERVVAITHLDHVLYQPIDTLSKGFRRRVGLAQALVHDPEVLIVDEPTDGLDPNQKHEVRELIGKLAQDKAIVLSTHILEEVDAVCSRAIIISAGRMVADGTPQALGQRAASHNAVRLGVPSDQAEAVRAALAGLANVAQVAVQPAADGQSVVLATPRQGATIIAEVAALARESGWPLTELHQERGRLDEVFRQITQGDIASSGSPGAPAAAEAVHA